jgi:predicted nuclease of predicted toxin-antitoxin system
MLIKLDENLPDDLRPVFSAHGYDVDTVPQEGLAGCQDSQVWLAAQMSKRFLVTQDLHFSDTRAFRPGTHAGILLLRLRNPARGALASRVERLLETEHLEDWAGCFVVVTDRKIRVVTAWE